MINNIPLVPENTIDPAAGLNFSLTSIDALLQIAVAGVGVNTPPVAPADGTRVAVGTAPTGVFSGHANEMALWTATPGYWTYFATAHVALNLADGLLYTRGTGAWSVVAGGTSGMSNPMTALYDLIVGGAAGAPTRLAVGGVGTVLTRTSGGLAWATPAATVVSVAPVVADTSSARTLALTDIGAYVRFTGSAPVITIPTQASVAWTADAEITIRHAGTGTLVLTPQSGVTLNAPSGGALQMTAAMTVTLKRVASNVWDVLGQTVAA